MIVNRAGIIDVLGKAPITIDEYIKMGMPGRKVARSWQFDTGECIRWMIEQATNNNSDDKAMKVAELRERAAKAGLAEIALAEKQKALIRVEDVIIDVETAYGVVKSRLQAIPGRLAQSVAVESDPVKVQKLIKDEVSEALEAISDPKKLPTIADAIESDEATED